MKKFTANLVLVLLSILIDLAYIAACMQQMMLKWKFGVIV